MQSPARTNKSSDLPQGRLAAFALIDNQLAQVKELIEEQLTCGVAPELHRLLGSFNSCSGKMLRGGLVLLSGGCIGEITDKHIHVAAIVEMIHNATLLHDDVIDEGQRRRGNPTVNNLWGNESSVLLGDFLLSRVFGMCVDLQPQVVRIIAVATAHTCEGELRQTVQRRNWQLSEAEYIDIITGKSAALFSSSCELGGLLAGASEDLVRSLADFGFNVGIAFQITDDLLDIIGDESRTGKTLGRDVDKDKLTLAVIHLLRVVNEDERKAVKDGLNQPGQNREFLFEMLGRFGSLEYARSRAREFIDKAVQSLAGLGESEAKEALLGIAGFVADRAN